MKRTAFCAALLCILLLAVPCAIAQTVGPKIVSADSLAFGKTYSEWAAALEQWADSIPASQHPLMDNGDCSVGQTGPVWFLAGKFCALNSPNCGTSNVIRHCNVPVGKALFVEVVGGENSTLETPSLTQIQDLRASVASFIDIANAALEVDGVSIPDLKANFRVQSPAFGFTLPKDNFFAAIGEGKPTPHSARSYKEGSYFPGVDDGVFVMLDPLPTGPHVVHLRGTIPDFNFVLDVTYFLNVQ